MDALNFIFALTVGAVIAYFMIHAAFIVVYKK